MKYIQRLNKSLNMKLILPALIITLFISCSAPKTETDLERYNLEGNIARITYLEYDAVEKFGDVSKGRLSRSEDEEINDNGNVFKGTYTSYYNHADDSIPDIERKNNVFVELSKFNNKNQKISVVNAKDNKIKISLIYNEDGKVIESNDYDEGKLSSKTKYVFVNGLLSESRKYKADGSLEEITKHKLDDDEIISELSSFSADGVYKDRVVYSHQGKLLTGYKFYSGKKLSFTVEMKYPKIETITERNITYK